MSELNDKLLEIKRQKDEYILPENLKKDVTVYGVTGTLEASGGDVKLFDTVEHMQADPDAKEGDLAIVYREEIQPVTEESEFNSCTFPNTVVLNEAFTDSIYGRFTATGSDWFDGMIDMSSSSFRFDGYGESDEIRVQYESEDSITYTRTDGGPESVDFGTTIKWESRNEWNNIIGNFMKIGGSYFDGLYEYSLNIDNIVASNTNNIDLTTDNYYTVTDSNIFVKISTLLTAANAIRRYICGGDNFRFSGDFYLSADLQNIICISNNNDGWQSVGILFGSVQLGNKLYIPVSSSNFSTPKNKIVQYNINNGTIEELNLTATVDYTYNNYTHSCTEFNGYYIATNGYNESTIIFDADNRFCYIGYYNIDNNEFKFLKSLGKKSAEYVIKSAQLDATPEYVCDKIFYGKNGVETGTLGTPDNSFADANAEVMSKMQAQYDDMTPQVLENDDEIANHNLYFVPEKTDGTPLLDTSHMTSTHNLFSDCRNLTHIALLDTSNVTSMNNMFNGCYNLKAVPLLNTSNVTSMNGMFSYCQSLKSIPLFDMSNVTMTISMFYNCYGLYTIPQLDTSNVTNMNGMFGGCKSLTDESLNNILAMCVSAIKITSNKTLKYIGITSTQATTCQSLSNYQAFINAGWTTGY